MTCGDRTQMHMRMRMYMDKHMRNLIHPGTHIHIHACTHLRKQISQTLLGADLPPCDQ